MRTRRISILLTIIMVVAMIMAVIPMVASAAAPVVPIAPKITDTPIIKMSFPAPGFNVIPMPGPGQVEIGGLAYVCRDRGAPVAVIPWYFWRLRPGAPVPHVLVQGEVLERGVWVPTIRDLGAPQYWMELYSGDTHWKLIVNNDRVNDLRNKQLALQFTGAKWNGVRWVLDAREYKGGTWDGTSVADWQLSIFWNNWTVVRNWVP